MSRVYFHSEEHTHEVLGSERAYANLLTTDIGVGLMMSAVRYEPARGKFLEGLEGVGYVPTTDRLLETALRANMGPLFLRVGGERVSEIWTMVLNTALRLGSRPVRFLARMHAQCEIHGWVDAPNRRWLAELVEEGLRDGAMRADSGWEGLISFLIEGEGPVVMSYSVTEPFPNRDAAEWEPDADPDDEDYDDAMDAWYEIPAADRWAMAMKVLRARQGGLELKPEDFDTYFFGIGLSALDLPRLLRD